MKKIALFLVILATFYCAGPVYAAAPSATAVTPQQSRMKACAAKYHQQKIDKSQYHQFMTQCLKNPPKDVMAKPMTKTPAMAGQQ